MYRRISDFVTEWKNEREATLKTFRLLTDATLDQKVNDEGRTLGFLAWHIVLTLGEMGSKMGLTITAPAEDSQQPARAGEIVSTYDIGARSVEEAVQSGWTDSSLDDEVNMYGEMWTRGFALSSLLKHQIHHRAQMTVLMRQAGLKVPGIYGPSREEWAQFGMTAPQ